jgi:Protein of unknown function (DUF2924)
MKWNGRSTTGKLKTAEKAELLARWRATMGTPPPFAPSRELLAMALAWHLQERKYGGLKPLVQRRLEALANAYRRGKLPAALLQACSFRPGTTLIQLWRGRRHTVVALPYGFRYQGKIYRSLDYRYAPQWSRLLRTARCQRFDRWQRASASKTALHVGAQGLCASFTDREVFSSVGVINLSQFRVSEFI